MRLRLQYLNNMKGISRASQFRENNLSFFNLSLSDSFQKEPCCKVHPYVKLKCTRGGSEEALLPFALPLPSFSAQAAGVWAFPGTSLVSGWLAHARILPVPAPHWGCAWGELAEPPAAKGGGSRVLRWLPSLPRSSAVSHLARYSPGALLLLLSADACHLTKQSVRFPIGMCSAFFSPSLCV